MPAPKYAGISLMTYDLGWWGNDPSNPNQGEHSLPAYVTNSVDAWTEAAGFDVVLCNATHLYFDLACQKDPLEPGYYWADFVTMRAPFEFIPLDVFKNAVRTNMGQPIDEKTLASRERLTSQGASHVLGIQGQLWGENLRDAERLEYMAFPRVIALAERAWARSPGWAQISDPTARDAELQRDWNQFANRLGQRELPRLDYLAGGVRYRLPPPGAVVRDGKIWANVAFPGLAIRYRIDSNDSNENSILYQSPISGSTSVKLQSFDTRGRGSRTIEVEGNKPGSTPVANTGLRL